MIVQEQKEKKMFEIIGNSAIIHIFNIGKIKRELKTELTWYGKLQQERGLYKGPPEPVFITNKYGSEYSFVLNMPNTKECNLSIKRLDYDEMKAIEVVEPVIINVKNLDKKLWNFDKDLAHQLIMNDILEQGLIQKEDTAIELRLGLDRAITTLYENLNKIIKVSQIPATTHKPEDFFTIREDGKIGKFVPKKLADAICEHYQFVATRERSNLWVYVPDKGIWDINGIEKIQAIAVKWLEKLFNSGNIQETTRYIRYSNYVSRKELEGDKSKVVLDNGVFNLDTGELEPFDPELYALAKIPIDYDPEAKCQMILKFLNELLPPEDVQKILELIGYCLLKDMPIARIVIFVGEGANGKSTLLNLVTTFLGKENVSNLTLQELSQGGFRISQIFGKLANISADIPANAIKDTSIIKMITGGDPITVEFKYKDPFKYHNYAKPIFSCNKLPETYDDSIAIHRRFVIINFDQFFTKEDADIHMIDKITTPEELSGLFNLAVDNLKTFLEQRSFSGEDSIEERKQEYIMKSNPAQHFCENFVEAVDDWERYVTKDNLYQAYVKFCRKHKKKPKANNHFTTQAKRFLPFVEEGRKRTKGKDVEAVKVWFGIAIKGEYEEEEEDSPNDDGPEWLYKKGGGE